MTSLRDRAKRAAITAYDWARTEPTPASISVGWQAAVDAVLATVRAELLAMADEDDRGVRSGICACAACLRDLADRIAPVPDQPEERTT